MIRGRGVEKRYGRKRVLRGIDISVPRGGFAVVTGPNGSGKTTLLRLLAGLALPSRGDLLVDADRSRIGYLAHEPLVYRELTAVENLDLYGRLYRIPERRERIGMLLERFSLWEARNERVVDVLAWHDAAACACAARSSTTPTCSCSTSRTRRSTRTAPRSSTASSRRSPGARTLVVATHDPARLAPLQS